MPPTVSVFPKSAKLPSDDEIRDLVHSTPVANTGDRFDQYRRLLLPLEQVKLNPEFHPEGDALNHTLQVFDLCVMPCHTTRNFLSLHCCTTLARRSIAKITSAPASRR